MPVPWPAASVRFFPAVFVPETAAEETTLFAEFENCIAERTAPPVMMSLVAAAVSRLLSLSENESPEASSVLPDTMFNCAAVDVTPSSLFSSAVVTVAPSNIPNSVSLTLIEPMPISPVNVGFAIENAVQWLFHWLVLPV